MMVLPCHLDFLLSKWQLPLLRNILLATLGQAEKGEHGRRLLLERARERETFKFEIERWL